MNINFFVVIGLVFLISACSDNRSSTESSEKNTVLVQSDLKNEKVRNHPFLEGMYDDSYFPKFLVDKGKDVLIHLCFQIEEKKPTSLSELYKLTHKATIDFNELQNEFYENNSELETVARDVIGMDFDFIAKAYDYVADVEMLIAPRDW